jgi:hypothetical protein
MKNLVLLLSTGSASRCPPVLLPLILCSYVQALAGCLLEGMLV